MKKNCIFHLFCSLFLYFGLSSPAQTGYITIQGRQFKDGNGNNFYPLVCNYVVDVVTPEDPGDYTNTFISPKATYGQDNEYSCDGSNSCDQELLNDFNEILSLGFNTVQIMGLNPIYHSQGDIWHCWDMNQSDWTCQVPGFYIQTHPLHTTPSITDCSEYPFHTINIDPPDATCLRIFKQMQHILEVASMADFHGKKLKVILRPSNVMGPSPETSDYRHTVDRYFYALMSYLSSNLSQTEKETLIGYDISSEIGYTWAYCIILPKFKTVG